MIPLMLGDPVGVIRDHDASAGKFEGVGIAAVAGVEFNQSLR
jgi:hypothetical protein